MAGEASEKYDILITDAGWRTAVTSVRSLGRAGLRVALGESVVHPIQNDACREVAALKRERSYSRYPRLVKDALHRTFLGVFMTNCCVTNFS